MKRVWLLILALALLAGAAGAVSAAPATPGLHWGATAGGGGASRGDIYTVSGTIGLPDAGQMGGGAYSLKSGFIAVVAQQVPVARLYMPFVVLNGN